jgi:hypothetical protein
MLQRLRRRTDRLDLPGVGIVLAGLILRTAQYLHIRALWLDEAMLALNVVRRSFAGLFQPLDYAQGAPIGFLLGEKAAIQILGNKDYVLRLLPFLAGCAALLLMYLIVQRFPRPAGWIALGLFAVCRDPVYYASEAKQYALDVAVGLFLLWLFLRLPDQALRWRQALLLGACGALALWFSHPAAFVLAGLGTTLLVKQIRGPKWGGIKPLLLVGTLWVASFAALYLLSLRHLTGNQFLLDYWADGFMPLPPWTNPNWFINISRGLFRNPGGLATPLLFNLPLLAVGLVALWRRNWSNGAILSLPFVFTLFASGFHVYPFAGRMVLFLTPLLYILLGEGIQAIRGLFKPGWLSLGIGLALAGFLFYAPIGGAADNLLHPKQREDLKPTLAYLYSARKADDLIYLYYNAAPAFEYYAPSYGFQPQDYLIGQDHHDQPSLYQAELQALTGRKRVWFLFSHVYERGDFNERDYLLARLDQIGSLTREVRVPGTSVYLYLYDLSQP